MRRAFITAALAAALLPSGAQAQNRCDPSDRYCAEVARLVEDAAIREALLHIDAIDAQGMRDLITLTEIPAPPFGEEERGRAFATMLRDAGADSVWTDEEGNVIALRRGSGERVVAIAGHLDTVFPKETDVTVKQRGDTLYAPGIGDDTREFVVPEGHYFMMGDNRDNSSDSRFSVGFVPAENLVGRANIIFFSIAGGSSPLEIWKWPTEMRASRLFDWVK
jgi:hypothetical protein